MKLYIIRIKGNEYSEKAAKRCLNSIVKFYPESGFTEEEVYFNAITPHDNPEKILKKYGIKTLKHFIEPYSRWHNVLAAFTSHFSIWKKILEDQKPGIIFEHDAVLVDNLPAATVKKYLNDEPNSPYRIKLKPHHMLGDIVNIGHPSYGKWNTPPNFGINPLTSKRYFPGAHAYYVTPNGAKMLIKTAIERAGPTDVFIHLDRFPNLQEWYPYSAVAKDNFSTIQNETGCQAKHGYVKERYKLVKV